jgi:YD repeat-containing protein
LISQQVIAVPSAQFLKDENGNAVDHTAFLYDEPNSDPLLSAQDGSTHHDETHYNSSHMSGRGNQTTVTRFDVVSGGTSLSSHMAYNPTGTISSITDAAGHVTKMYYDDSFSDGNNSRKTLAYPTSVIDPDNDPPSTSQYNYDFGSATISTDPKGAQTLMTYDAAGRPLQSTYHDSHNNVDGTHIRYVYPNSQNMIQSFTLTQTGAIEAYSLQALDGAGRVRATASDFPDSVPGVAHTYRGQTTDYDVLGQKIRQSNPTEMDGQWNPVGADSPGWYFTKQTYDWKGRPLMLTNADGTSKSLSYGGCGCAGGDITTSVDEVKRKTVSTKDILGRTTKVDIYDWDPVTQMSLGSIYLTTIKNYNVRDQILTSVTTQVSNGQSETTTATYDGFGRPSSKQTPRQLASGGQTSFFYNPDDTVNHVIDPRGATAAYSYNNRKLITGVTYNHPSGTDIAPNLTFTYDEDDNRTSMTDGSGHVDYQYDAWSHVTSETRTFTNLVGKVVANGSYKLSYTYNLVGELASITDPYNRTVSYAYDSTGQLNEIDGSNYQEAGLDREPYTGAVINYGPREH